MIDVRIKIKELLKTNPDPRKGWNEEIMFHQMQVFLTCPPVMGVVVDNKDPDLLGRIRVSLDMLSPGAVSSWIPIVGRWKKKSSGVWLLPEIGTQALVAFTAKDRSKAFVLGFIYDKKHMPPEHRTQHPKDSMLYQTKNHRLEIIDEEKSEQISFETAKGKMRVCLSKNDGIKIVNELGEINIKCQNLKIKSESNTTLKAKSIKFNVEGGTTIKTKGKTDIESDSKVTLKAQNIKAIGSNGVTAEKKQIAKQNDKVMGFDIHTMVVPSGNGTTTVPLPHPFIGQLKDILSKDVKIGDKKCATKGSVSKHKSQTHLQLPGTIKFQNNPDCKGEITGGTVASVKIDGKETAVIGSTVTTCNDIGAKNNSTVMAVGVSFPMLDIISPLATEEYNKEQEEKEKKDRQFKNVRWEKSQVEEGENIILSATVKDIEDGNMVTLQVFPEERGPENGVAYAAFPLILKDGAVSAVWSYRADCRRMPPKVNPRFICTAHSAWCPWKKSDNSLEVKLIRPEITKVEWQNIKGNTVNKGLVGDVLKLMAEVKDFEEKQGVTFNVYDEHKRQVASLSSDVNNGKAETEWTYNWNGEKLMEKPKFTFEVTATRCKNMKSGECEIGQKINITLLTDDLYLLSLSKCYLTDDDSKKDIEIKNGSYEDVFIPGKWKLFAKNCTITNNSLKNKLDDFSIIQRFDFMDLETGIPIKMCDSFCIMFETRLGGSQ